jgi:hypothetical protein
MRAPTPMPPYPSGISTKEQRRRLRWIIDHRPVVRRSLDKARRKVLNNATRTGVPVSKETMSILTLTAAYKTVRYIERQRGGALW